MSLLTITIDTGNTADRVTAVLNCKTGSKKQNLTNIENFISGLNGGSYDFTSGEVVSGSQAFGLVTFTGAPTAEQTVTINGVVFTARASGATGNEFNIGASVTETASNLVTAFNASATSATKGIVASSSAGVVTLSSKVAGESGLYTLASTLSNATVTAWALPSTTSVRVSF